MKKRVLSAILVLIGIVALASCTQVNQTDSKDTATATDLPIQSESDKNGEHIDENQGEWDTEDFPSHSPEASPSDKPTTDEPTSAEEQTTNEPTTAPDGETQHDNNQGEWDVE